APELHAAIWEAYHEGELESARELHNRALPLLNMESLYPLQLYKEVLRRRGVIRSAKVRNEFLSPFDEFDHRELDAILDDLADVLVTRGPFA
ncbi:MAG: dihydrodipicolinate synthase family protein, partial [Planctomycetota bacterium]|nr:dihydrodipicolinate synthase family protein [Planctomycetota bacterium]